MSEAPVRVLLIEDSPDDADLLRELLGGSEFAIDQRETLAEARRILAESPPDLLLLDLHLPDGSGLETMEGARAHSRSLPIVVLTGSLSEEDGVAALRAGASDYLLKDQLGPDLPWRLRYAIERHSNERVLRTFAALLSHELRHALGVVGGYGDELADLNAGPGGNGSLRRISRRVREIASDTVRLIDATLELSRTERSTAPLQRESVDAGKLFESLAAEFRVRGGADVDLVWRSKVAQPVWTDAVKLKMILRNLVANAVRVAAGGRVAVGADLESDRVVFSVKDSGPGIPSAEIPRLLQAFRQGGEPGHAGRAGLGLYVVDRLTESLGGRLELRSNGDGSVFRVSLPGAIIR
jgi:signal transduction histidine kinase